MKKGISTILTICLTVVIMAGLATGGWYYLNKKWQNDKSNRNNQIAALNVEIQALQKAADETSSSTEDALDVTNGSETSTSSTTASTLSTYTSATYAYSFQYPESFYLVDWLWNGQSNTRVAQNGKVVWVSKSVLSERAILMDADPFSQYFSVSVADAACGLSAIRGDGTGIVIEDSTLDGVYAWKARITDATNTLGGQYTTTYYANHGSYCYQLQIVNSNAAGTHDAEIDAMVASFDFN